MTDEHPQSFSNGKEYCISMPQGKQTVSDDEILGLFETADAPFMTAGEIADAVDMTRQGIHNRLQELYEAGELERKDGGHRTVIWWIAD